MKIPLDEWEFLAHILRNGYPLEVALDFLELPSETIKQRLKQGYKVSDALFCDGQGSFYEHVRFFVKQLPLEDAIIQSVQLSAAFENIKSTLKKSAVYPCVLLLSAFVLLFFFTNAIIPTMMQTFSDMNDFKTLSLLVQLVLSICLLFVFLLVLMGIALLYLYSHKPLLLRLLMKYPIKPVKEYLSYRFATYILQLQRCGISTQQMMCYFDTLAKQQLFSMYMKRLNQLLSEGNELYQSLMQLECFTSRFLQIFPIGMASNRLDDFLEGYQKQQLHQWQKQLKKVSIWIQLIAYSFVGLVVFLVYQIMLVPLGMLENM